MDGKLILGSGRTTFSHDRKPDQRPHSLFKNISTGKRKLFSQDRTIHQSVNHMCVIRGLKIIIPICSSTPSTGACLWWFSRIIVVKQSSFFPKFRLAVSRGKEAMYSIGPWFSKILRCRSRRRSLLHPKLDHLRLISFHLTCASSIGTLILKIQDSLFYMYIRGTSP